MNCGIDQTTFIKFLDGFGMATPEVVAFESTKLGINVVDVFLTPFAPGVAIGIEAAVESVQEKRSRQAQNAYLQKMNKELFEPRGLRCLIFAYDANKDQVLDEGNTTSMSLPRSRKFDGTMGGANLPKSAGLMYPDPYEGVEKKSGLGGAIGDKVSRTLKDDEAKDDVKAQVKYLIKNPNSPLQPLLDPKAELTEKDLLKQEKHQNKMNEKQEKEDRKREKREEEKEKKRLKRKEQGKEEKQSDSDSSDDKSKDKKITKGILCLMIVNASSHAPSMHAGAMNSSWNY